MTDRDLLKQALEALESAKYGMAECRQEIGFDFANEQYDVEQAITALRERLADNTIHSCSYYCERPDCVRAQRDELRERLAQPEPQTQQRPPNCGTSYCSCIECVMEPEQPEQEPVAWMNPSWADPDTRGWPSDSFESIPIEGWMPLYTTPPRREWVGLTDEDMVMCESEEDVRFVRAIEAKLKKKNE